MDEIRAKTFIVADDNGIQRAFLGVNDEGPKLELHNENENRCALLAVNENSTILNLTDQYIKSGVQLRVGNDEPGLIMYDKNKTVFNIDFVGENSPSLSLKYEDGSIIWQAP